MTNNDVVIAGPQSFAVTATGKGYVRGLREVMANTIPNSAWRETVISTGGMLSRAESIFTIEIPANVRLTLSGSLAEAVRDAGK